MIPVYRQRVRSGDLSTRVNKEIRPGLGQIFQIEELPTKIHTHACLPPPTRIHYTYLKIFPHPFPLNLWEGIQTKAPNCKYWLMSPLSRGQVF